MQKKLQGILGPVPIFLSEEGIIDFNSNVNACKRLIQSEIDGLFLCSTREFPHLTAEERQAYISIFNDSVFQSKPVVCCISQESQEKTMKFIESVLNEGIQYLSVSLPQRFPEFAESSSDFFTNIRKLIDDFNPSIPLLTQSKLSSGTTIHLVDGGILQGIVYSSPNADEIRNITNKICEKFTFLCGSESMLFYGFRDGQFNTKFDGGLFHGANIMPSTYKKLFLATKEGNKDEFARLWPLVDEFTALYDKGTIYLPQIVKYAMKIAGYTVTDKIQSSLGIIDTTTKKYIENYVLKIQSYWGTSEI